MKSFQPQVKSRTKTGKAADGKHCSHRPATKVRPMNQKSRMPGPKGK